MISVKYSDLKKIAFIIIALPFIVFSIGWLKWYWAVLSISAMAIVLFFGIFQKKDISESEKEINISYRVIIATMVLSLIWVWLSGIGGFWGQSKDFAYRNAIYRDIVLRDWPVKYPVTGHALVYYIGFWLFPSLFGKAALFLGVSDSVAFDIANAALFVWTALIIFIVLLLAIYTIGAMTPKKQLFIAVLFIIFSGMDIWGNVGYDPKYIKYHYEWWAMEYQYSSFTTCLFWVFNQAVPAWLCFLCLVNEKSIKNYVFIGMMCLFCSPLPFVGWLLYAVLFAIEKAIEKIRQKNVKEYLVNMFSLSNICSAFFFFPFIGTYLLSNAAIHGSGAFQTSNVLENDVLQTVTDSAEGVVQISNTHFANAPILRYFSFICIEFAIYMILVAWKYKIKPVYYVTFISLCLIPLFRIGSAPDFSMRASIPGLVMVFLFVGKFLVEEKKVLKLKGSLQRMTYILLIVFVLLGAFTPGMEVFRGTKEVIELGIKPEKNDKIYTLGCDGPYDDGTLKCYGNFVATDLDEHIFFRVFCK